MKKITALALALCLLLVGCASETPPEQTAGPTAATTPQPTEPAPPVGEVRILETDPTYQPIWQALGEEYTALTGVSVTLQTSEAAPLALEENSTPSLFTIDDQTSPVFWAEFCMNLSGQPLCSQLLSPNFALRHGDKIVGIAARTEVFGLVYNPSLLARAGYTREEITSLEALSTIAADITANRDTFGFAAFACPDLSATGSGSFTSLFGSIPGDSRTFWDIYIQNAACDPEDIAKRTTSGGLEELIEGEAVFYLAGTEDREKFSPVNDLELAILPLFADGQQGLCATNTYYWCIHASASEDDRQATLDFLNWLVSPRADGSLPADDFESLSPYRQAQSTDPLLSSVRSQLLGGTQALVCPLFSGDSEALAKALAAYAADPSDANWQAVTQALQQPQN